ncbi:XkdX family protein [Lacrimispora amygdalina]|uniref:XkdX family protein n=1 Tax=Lacrimispora amygdalina TaxID=253257 RepID=A0A3E2NFS7_9FIRM|nr:XkdX family protein [Clostridium indicum]RFZ79845.1 XkdX family protein [Clostridium indicum]
MSKNYEKVKQFYDTESWPLNWVQDAVNRWITAAEYQEITGKEYEKE